MQDVAQRQHAFEIAFVVDDYQPVNTSLPNGIEDGIKSIIQRAGVNAGEVLSNVSQRDVCNDT